MGQSSLLAFAAALLLARHVTADGLYSKTSPVLQLSGSTYDSLIAKSNHTSIVEFYAPWCGHCKNLKPAYEKAAKSLTGLAKVAAVNCDEDSNKPFCGSMGVQGFPTLKIVKPGKKAGKPIVEDYQGPRDAKNIVDAVVDKIPNHVKRLKDSDYQAWLEEGEAPKALLFSDKGTTSALLKALAIDFLGAVDVAQIRSTQKDVVEKFDVDKFPTLVLIPGKDQSPIKHDGEMKKDALVTFLSQAAAPNPDPAPKKAKSTASSKSSKSKPADAKSGKSKASSEEASCPYGHDSKSKASSQGDAGSASQTKETLEDQSQPTESPDPKVVPDDTDKPVKVQDPAPLIPSLADEVALQHKCLNSKSGTCILFLVPTEKSIDSASLADTLQLISTLSEIRHKHDQAQRKIFPFVSVPGNNPQAAVLRKQLSLSEGAMEIVALNGKRSWYRRYQVSSFEPTEVENWIDSIRMGDGTKEKLPAAVVVQAADLPPEPDAEPVTLDTTDPEAMKEALKAQMPDGVDFEFEEINDVEYDRIMADASRRAEAREAKESADAAAAAKEEAKEGKATKEKVDHIIDEL